ncbi:MULTISPECIES: DUF2066 domain-containing protein [unclassified Iodidimonas]|uniref:DUF2066 domain-containing protein n=1 Tax=unclassified Iodidimonas TaxID=2626145 RepID=UPI002482DAC3|nr:MULTISPECIES: DUF2066 domain-containing protein [unclassified Iodidimonas]
MLFGIGGPAQAQMQVQADRDASARLFSVYGIDVDVEAANATEARRQALANAQERAWQSLIEKLVADESLGNLPPASPPLLQSLVRSVDIREEKFSSRRYMAVLDVSFSPDAVRDIFARTDVAYTESLGGPYLLVPVLYDRGVRRVFGNHEWQQALAGADLQNRLIAYRFAPDRISSRAVLSDDLLANPDPSKLAKAARFFAVPRIVIATARLVPNYRTGQPDLHYDLVVGPLDDEGESRISHAEGSLSAFMEDFGPSETAASETEAELLQRAANLILRRSDALWKEQTLLAATGDQSVISVMAPVDHAEDWLLIRQKLASVGIVRSFEMIEIGLPLSRFTISYVGTIEQLRLALAQARLQLLNSDQGLVLITDTADEGREMRAPQADRGSRR